MGERVLPEIDFDIQIGGGTHEGRGICEVFFVPHERARIGMRLPSRL